LHDIGRQGIAPTRRPLPTNEVRRRSQPIRSTRKLSVDPAAGCNAPSGEPRCVRTDPGKR
jgi:hypothetical protein